MSYIVYREEERSQEQIIVFRESYLAKNTAKKTEKFKTYVSGFIFLAIYDIRYTKHVILLFP